MDGCVLAADACGAADKWRSTNRQRIHTCTHCMGCHPSEYTDPVVVQCSAPVYGMGPTADAGRHRERAGG